MNRFNLVGLGLLGIGAVLLYYAMYIDWFILAASSLIPIGAGLLLAARKQELWNNE